MELFAAKLLWIHRMIGYPTAFLVAPIAFLSFTGARIHRGWGKAYLYLMMFLYATGTFFTFYHHPLDSRVFARNLAFNLFGFSLVFYGYRAIYRLYRRPHGNGTDRLQPTGLDRGMAAVLLVLSAALVIAGMRHFPMLVFGLLGVTLSVVEFRELRTSGDLERVLFSRHLRYMFASYFYVLTVISVVHVRAPQALKWLWPAALGIAVVYLATRDPVGPGTLKSARRLKLAVQLTLAAAALLGIYIATTAFFPVA